MNIIVTHRDIRVSYNEVDNRWYFELDGRERSAESLVKAKEFIDNPPKEKKVSTFKRVDAFYGETTWDIPLKVTVTSIAENRSSRPDLICCWIIDSRGDRRKVGLEYLFGFTPENIDRIKAMREVEKQEKELDKQRGSIRKSLTVLKLEV